MGTVFLAEQDKPTRLVALKIIRPGVASANLLRRFESGVDDIDERYGRLRRGKQIGTDIRDSADQQAAGRSGEPVE